MNGIGRQWWRASAGPVFTPIRKPRQFRIRAPRWLGDRIIICTAAGLVVIDRETGAPVPDDDAPGHDPAADFCQFCLPILHGKAATPVVAEPPLPAVGTARCEPPLTTESWMPGRRFGAAWPGGPPPSRPL
ncbi:hypothetical protein [Azospirillum brasilense]|uniref:hypothetical protein n=1 Tax=Azospirillum brasilense TaxID=192 RepID=UPI001EDA07DD|nr:hypothetical protein [Azospirillum brasilense]UKJ76047.1 hypothetical protein H1Q64_17760 [Azospirillum brasilense]